jgi:hypothetical protein
MTDKCGRCESFSRLLRHPWKKERGAILLFVLDTARLIISIIKSQFWLHTGYTFPIKMYNYHFGKKCDCRVSIVGADSCHRHSRPSRYLRSFTCSLLLFLILLPDKIYLWQKSHQLVSVPEIMNAKSIRSDLEQKLFSCSIQCIRLIINIFLFWSTAKEVESRSLKLKANAVNIGPRFRYLR